MAASDTTAADGPDADPSSRGADGGGRELAVAALTLARRFAAGATMWCVAPVWAEHARHVAVEFVHPVIVGKRALPAVTVDAPDPVASLRTLAVAGDVLVVIGDAGVPGAVDLLRRAGAWGLTTVWIGAGERPAGGTADHILWQPERAAGRARFDGSVVRLYHVLWELTHVCFEHGAALVPPNPESSAGEVCVTCADEGRPGEVLQIDEGGTATVRTSRGVEQVDTSLVAVTAGDLVLIHAGTAIAVLGEELGGRD
jgi:hypothetical protein